MTVVLDCGPGGNADLERFLSTAGDPGFDPARGGRHPLPPLERWTAQLGAWGIGPDTEVVCFDAVQGQMGGFRAWWMLKALGHGPVSVVTSGTKPRPATGPARGPYPAKAWLWPTIGLTEAAAWATDPKRVLVDVRAAERWRGEVEPIDPVAGRIPGSVNLPLGVDWAAVAARWRAEGVAPYQVAVHCGSGVSACTAIHGLSEAGFGPVTLYVGSYSEWCRQ